MVNNGWPQLKVGTKVHTYIGWGIVVRTGYIWYLVKFPSGMTGKFPVNQLSLD